MINLDKYIVVEEDSIGSLEIEVNDYTKVLKQAESYKTTNETEFLDDNNGEGEKIMQYFFHYLQALNNTKELKYILAYVAKETGFENRQKGHKCW